MILVTGGTGFVGTYLLYELSKEETSIKSTYRKEKNKELTKKFFKLKDQNHPKLFNKIIWVKIDISEISSLDELYSGIKKIYHCAAFVSLAKRHKKLLIKTNVEEITSDPETASTPGAFGALTKYASSIKPGEHSPGIASQSPASNSNSSHHKLTGITS